MAVSGTACSNEASDRPERHATGNEETSASGKVSDDGRGWVRTSDLSRVKRALSH